jgi:protein-tyrosine-phosphatase
MILVLGEEMGGIPDPYYAQGDRSEAYRQCFDQIETACATMAPVFECMKGDIEHYS